MSESTENLLTVGNWRNALNDEEQFTVEYYSDAKNRLYYGLLNRLSGFLDAYDELVVRLLEGETP